MLKRWRGASANEQANLDDGPGAVRALESVAAAPLQPAQTAEPARPSLLKRPLTDRLDLTKAFQAPAQTSRLRET